MTINGPAPIHPGDVFLNTAMDQQVDASSRSGQRPAARIRTNDDRDQVRDWALQERARDRAGRHPQGGPGLRIPAFFPRSSRSRLMADIQEYFVASSGPQFLFGLDLRLPYRRGGGQSDFSAGLHPWPMASPFSRPILQSGHARRRFRPQSVASSSPTAWIRSMPYWDAWRGAYGPLRWRGCSSMAPTSRSQKLKYHIQTSRAVRCTPMEMAFNDIRTTLAGPDCHLHDNCNSLHTNAYDEAVTTPTDRFGA